MHTTQQYIQDYFNNTHKTTTIHTRLLQQYTQLTTIHTRLLQQYKELTTIHTRLLQQYKQLTTIHTTTTTIHTRHLKIQPVQTVNNTTVRKYCTQFPVFFTTHTVLTLSPQPFTSHHFNTHMNLSHKVSFLPPSLHYTAPHCTSLHSTTTGFITNATFFDPGHQQAQMYRRTVANFKYNLYICA